MSDAWRGGSTRRYRKIRAMVLVRDGGRCRLGPIRAERGDRDVCTYIGNQAHHLDGKAAGDDPSRMIASCGPCNIAEGDPTERHDNDPPATASEWWA